MAVEPGFVGQKFIPQVPEKIRAIRRHLTSIRHDVPIVVDGGVNEETGAACVKAGADVLVLGTASIFKKGKDLAEECLAFRRLMNEQP